ncbi:MAG: FHA domain-containing protein [Armatimonadetes bacterium]|nr:FHA domain-containing protein [Armatimonadota bacterium]
MSITPSSPPGPRSDSIVSAPKFAVTPTGYDDIAALLERMGTGYRYAPIDLQSLGDPARVDPYQVLFINCAEDCKNQDLVRAAAPVLRQYVEGGGTLYASDWAAGYVNMAFPEPEYIQFVIEPTDAQRLDARVEDRGLAEYLKATQVALTFDKNAWVPIGSVGSACTVHLTGTYTCEGDILRPNRPLLASFQCGQGHVIYTTFHNEAHGGGVVTHLTCPKCQHTTTLERAVKGGEPFTCGNCGFTATVEGPEEPERALDAPKLEQQILRFLILKPVTAGLSSASTVTMRKADFLVDQHIPGIVSSGETSERYDCPAAGNKTLRMTLNWTGAARLRLSAYRPSGELHDAQEAEAAPLVIEVPRATTGVWSCTVTGVAVPYPNFPYALDTGLKRGDDAAAPRPAGADAFALTSPVLVTFRDGITTSPTYPIDPAGTPIGRGPDHKIALDDPTVSRKVNAIIRRQGTDFVIEAGAGLANPVELNGKPLREGEAVVLRWWDTLTFGGLSFCIVNEGDGPAGSGS